MTMLEAQKQENPDLGEYARAAVAKALKHLMRELPDKGKDRDAALAAALKDLEQREIPDEEYRKAVRIVRTFLEMIPHRWGSSRRLSFWNLALRFMPAQEAAEAFLVAFPNALTDAQYQEVRSHLKRQLGLDEEQLEALLARFERRQRQTRPEDPGTEQVRGPYFVPD